MVADQVGDQINHHDRDRQVIQVQVKINDQITHQQRTAQSADVGQRIEARFQPGIMINGEDVPE
ncbi:hypothetical protein D3C73_1615160 [compost metagenome]